MEKEEFEKRESEKKALLEKQKIECQLTSNWY